MAQEQVEMNTWLWTSVVKDIYESTAASQQFIDLVSLLNEWIVII